VGANRITGEYSLHPLDREYAYRQLPDDEETDAYNRRNLELRAADFYISIRKPESEWKTIDDLAPQLAEFEHRVRAGDYDSACQVLEPIDSAYLFLWGHYSRLVELREKLLGRLTAPHLQAANLGSLGIAYHAMGQFEQAIKLYEEALDIARRIRDRRGEGRWLGQLGITYQVLGQVEQAIKLYEEALVATREIGDRRNEGVWLGRLSRAYHSLGQVEQGIRLCKDALSIAREIGDRRREGVWLDYLGRVYYDLGQVERTINLYRDALAIAREIGHRWKEGTSLGRLGIAYHALGQFERAIKFYEKALTIAREIGNRRGEGNWLAHLGDAYRDSEQVERAINLCEDALAIACEIGDQRLESDQLLELGKAFLTARKLSEARQHCTQALVLDMPQISCQAALVLGIVLLRQRDPSARETFADAAARCRVMLDKTAGLYKPRYALAAALVGSAVCDPRWAEEGERAGLLAPALAEYRRALENCAAPGVVRDALHDLEMIRAAGIEGLEPAFELLKSALPTSEE
jgi:tetratricopeptide (TPR) repeat protein